MERIVAIKKLGKILGKSLGYRVDPKAPDQDGRDEAKAKLREAFPKLEALSKERDDRKSMILRDDAEYQRLKAAHADAKKCYDELYGITCHYRFTVGTSNEMFFMVKAQGDSWEQVIAKLTAKENA